MKKLADWTTNGNIGILTLNHPPQNFLQEPEFINLEELAEWTKPLKGLIITGKGRHFSAGANPELLKEQILHPEAFQKQMERGLRILNFIENLDIPVIAAIRGICFGGGLEIALCCHIRIAAENALFAFPEANHGLIPGLGGIIRCKSLSGESLAIPFLLSGDTIGAEKALSLNLVDEIIPSKEVMDYSLNLMAKMTEGRSLLLIHNMMLAIKNSRNMPSEQAMEEETKLFCALALKTANQNS